MVHSLIANEGTPFIDGVQLKDAPLGRFSVKNRPVPGRNPAFESG